jgi:hypothetical protein
MKTNLGSNSPEDPSCHRSEDSQSQECQDMRFPTVRVRRWN